MPRVSLFRELFRTWRNREIKRNRLQLFLEELSRRSQLSALRPLWDFSSLKLDYSASYCYPYPRTINTIVWIALTKYLVTPNAPGHGMLKSFFNDKIWNSMYIRCFAWLLKGFFVSASGKPVLHSTSPDRNERTFFLSVSLNNNDKTALTILHYSSVFFICPPEEKRGLIIYRPLPLAVLLSPCNGGAQHLRVSQRVLTSSQWGHRRAISIPRSGSGWKTR